MTRKTKQMVSVPREWLNQVALLQMPLDELQEQAVEFLCEPCDEQPGPAVILDLVQNKVYGGLHIRKWDNIGDLAEGTYKLYADKPAPVAVVLAEAREWLGDGKNADGLSREHWTPEYAALIDRIDATLSK